MEVRGSAVVISENHKARWLESHPSSSTSTHLCLVLLTRRMGILRLMGLLKGFND